MSKLFDALTRSLLEKYPADWLNQLGLIHGEPVRVMNSDLSSVTAEADKVIRVEGPQPWLVHIELGPIPKSGDAPKSTGVRYAKGRRPNNTGDWQLGKSPLWKCFWSRKSKWAGTRKREEESVSVPTALRHPR